MFGAFGSIRFVRFVVYCSGAIIAGSAAAGAQSYSVDEIIERLRDQTVASEIQSRRGDVLEELRRNRAAGLSYDQRRRLWELSKLYPTINLDINFDYNKASLSPQAYPQLLRLMEALPKASPRSDFLVIGHTDSLGSSDYNQTLSENRAKSVVEFITRNSAINPNRLISLGFGSQYPLTPATPDAAINRRVQIVNFGPPIPPFPQLLPPVALRTSETTLWGLVAMLLLTGFASRFWMTARAFEGRARENGNRAAKLQGVFETLNHTVQNLGGLMQQRFAAIEGHTTQLIGTTARIRHDTRDVEKHVDKLEVTKTGVTTKVASVKEQVEMEAAALQRIADQVKQDVDNIVQKERQVDHLENEVHNIGMVNRIANQVKSKMAVVDRNARQLDHIEQELLALHSPAKLNGNGHGHKWHGDHDHRHRALVELQSADRKIEKLMEETIQIEAGQRIIYVPERDAVEMAKEFEEHHRKLIEQAQDIFADVRKYLNHAAVQLMEAKNDQIDWSRGELFSNTGSSDAAKAYHQQIREYLVKLKEVISRCLHEMM